MAADCIMSDDHQSKLTHQWLTLSHFSSHKIIHWCHKTARLSSALLLFLSLSLSVCLVVVACLVVKVKESLWVPLHTYNSQLSLYNRNWSNWNHGHRSVSIFTVGDDKEGGVGARNCYPLSNRFSISYYNREMRY